MYNSMYETSHQSRFNARYWMLGAGVLGRPRGMVWGGRREEGSGWGTHVYLSLLFNILSRLVVMAFLPRGKCLLISWWQSLSAVILEPPKIKSLTVCTDQIRRVFFPFYFQGHRFQTIILLLSVILGLPRWC